MEEQLNCLPSLVEGNKKRPPTEFVARLAVGDIGAAKVHTIDRDISERYKVVVTSFGAGLRVFDINGNERTVSMPNGNTYLSSSNPQRDYRLLTIADYTFIVNTNVTVAMTGAVTATRGYEALIFVKQVELDYDYTVSVNGTSYTYHTHHETPPSAADIAKGICDAMTTGGLTATVDRATVWVTSATPLDVRAYGPNTDIDLRSFTKTAQNFTDLPTIAPTDYHIEVVGDPSNNFDNYYVKFKPNISGATFDSGQWVETIAEGVAYRLDPSTMPHVLIRNGDGTFTFKEAAWTDRTVGDNDTASIPSFVGEKINDVVFHKDRLGFLADSNVVLSETGKFFNFFRTTVTALLDTDPVDVSVNQVAILRSGIEFDKQLLMFSDKPVFTLGSGDLLTPKSASTDTVTKFESVPTTQPVATDKAVYFASPKSTFAGLRELVVDPVSQRPDAPEVTSHVPKYIPGTITKLALSQNENIVVAIADGDPSTLFAYNFFWNGNQKLQSAWGKWTFNGATIVSAEFLNSVLYIVLQRADGAYLVQMDVSPKRTDSADVQHLTNLDMRITNAQCSIAYNAGTNRTTFTLPYTVNAAANYQVITRYASAGDIPGTVIADGVVASGNTLSCPGDLRTVPCYIGEQYVQQFTLSEQFVTYKDQQGNENMVPDAKLKLLFLTIVFEKTGYFRVVVDYAHRPDAPQTTEFQGRIIGSSENATDMVALEDGSLRTRVGADSSRCRITIINDSFMPANFQSISWEGRETIRTRQGA